MNKCWWIFPNIRIRVVRGETALALYEKKVSFARTHKSLNERIKLVHKSTAFVQSVRLFNPTVLGRRVVKQVSEEFYIDFQVHL